MSKLTIYTDGGARNNPGPAGIGIVIKNENGETIKTYKEYIGEKTNNQAEYEALLRALELVKGEAEKLEIFLDSQLVVNQAKSIYRAKNGDIKNLLFKLRILEQNFKEVQYNLIPREQNREADKLVNRAIDEEIKNQQ